MQYVIIEIQECQKTNLDFNVIITTLDFTSVGNVCCNVQM